MQSFILVLGATSDIGRGIMYAYARQGVGIYLAGRNMDELGKEAANIEIRFNVPTKILPFDALNHGNHAGFFEGIVEPIEAVFCVFGYYGDQLQARASADMAREIMMVNYVGAVSIMEECTRWCLANDRKPTLVGISSVAGDRGRAKNYLYGSSKAGFTAYLSGLRNRLIHDGIHVLSVKPGFVATKMTAHLDLNPRLTADPEKLGEKILHATRKQKNVLYYKSVWGWIMWVIRHIPEGIFKRMRI